jgi:hypothetical protein
MRRAMHALILAGQPGTRMANRAPSITSNAGKDTATLAMAENTTSVTTVKATDPDRNTVLSYAIVGGADASLFSINPSTGALAFKIAPDYEAPLDADRNNSYEVIVSASDSLLSDTQVITVIVTDVAEVAPRAGGVSISSLAGADAASVNVLENSTAVTRVQAAGPSRNAIITYSIAGGSDGALFTIDPSTGVLAFREPPDRERPGDAGADNVYNVIVQASDGRTSDTQTLAVTVGNLNEAPAITSAATFLMAENMTSAGTVTASDPDAGSTLTYGIAGGADAALFVINQATGALSFRDAPDFERALDADGNNGYQVTVQVTDGSITVTQELTVRVTDVVEAVSTTLSPAADLVVGGPEDSVISATAATLNPADKINAGGGTDTLELVGSGTFRVDQLAELTGVERLTLTNTADNASTVFLKGSAIPTVVGSEAHESFISVEALQPGMSINAGGGSNSLSLGASSDLTQVTLSGFSMLSMDTGTTLIVNQQLLDGLTRLNGAGTLATREASMDLRGITFNNFAQQATFASINPGGTVFTVDSLVFANRVVGGPGPDTLVISNLTLTDVQRAQLFAQGSIESITDAAGTHARKPGVTLTLTADTVAGGVEDSTIVATAVTLNPTDKINAGGGLDTLELVGSGTFRIDQLAELSGVERLTMTNDPGSAATVYLRGSAIPAIVGSEAHESFISVAALQPGMFIEAGGGSNSLYVGASSDLTQVTLSGFSMLGMDTGTTLIVNQQLLDGLTRLNGAGVLATREASMDLRGITFNNFAQQATFASTNPAGTVFTVDSLLFAKRVMGGPGSDTLFISGVTLSDAEREQLFAQGSIDAITDASGSYTKKSVALLTADADVIEGGPEDSEIRASVGTLTEGDQIDGGEGHDTLLLYGPGAFHLGNASVLAGIEEVRIAGDEGAAVYLRTATDLLIVGSEQVDYFRGGTTFGAGDLGSGGSILSGGGADHFEFYYGAHVGAGTLVDMGDGADDFFSTDSHTGGVIRAGMGSDNLRFFNANIGPAARIELGGDADNLEIYGPVAETAALDGGDGIDRLILGGASTNLADPARVKNFESIVVSGGTFGINQALVSGGVLSGENATLQTAEATLDLSGWSFGPNFIFTSTNATGTAFKVTDLATGLNVRGGPGTADSLLAIGFTFTAEQRALLLQNGLETVTDDSGSATNNRAPIGTPTATLVTTEDLFTIIEASQFLLGFSDPDGDALEVRDLAADHGQVSENGNGTYAITPETDYNGTVTLSYKVADAAGATVAAQIGMTVNPVNDAPRGSATAVLEPGLAETPYRITREQLLQGFTDVDGDSLQILNLYADSGFLRQNDDGSYTLTPAVNFDGTVHLSYAVYDGSGGIGSGSLNLEIEPRYTGNQHSLTPGVDQILDGDGDSEILATHLDINSGDQIDAGGGYDTLVLLGGGGFALHILHATGVDAIRIISDVSPFATPSHVILSGAIDYPILGGLGTETLYAVQEFGPYQPAQLVPGGSISTGGGADFLQFQGVNASSPALLPSGTSIDMGADNDMAWFNDYVFEAGGSVQMGAAGDSLNLTRVQILPGALLDGGEEIDQISFTDMSADLTETSSIVNFESFRFLGGTYLIDQAFVDGAAIDVASHGTLETSGSTLDLSTWSVNGDFTFGTRNAAGTAFRVADVATAFLIQGGAGSDTVVTDEFTFADHELAALFTANIETVVDMAGTHAAPSTVELTREVDAVAPSTTDITIRAPIGTLTAGDSIDGGAGVDTLRLEGAGAFDLRLADTFENVERIQFVHLDGVAQLYLPEQAAFDISGTDQDERIDGETYGGGNISLFGGADVLWLCAPAEWTARIPEGSLVDFGDGNDYLYLQGTLDGTVEGGDGDDVFVFFSDFGPNGHIDGGAGDRDSLLTSTAQDLTDPNMFVGIEFLELQPHDDYFLIDQAAMDRFTITAQPRMRTAESTLDLRLDEINAQAQIYSDNAAGTTFRVAHLSTAMSIYGGAGPDSVVTDNLAFTELELDTLLQRVETVVDIVGVHTRADLPI